MRLSQADFDLQLRDGPRQCSGRIRQIGVRYLEFEGRELGASALALPYPA